MKDTSSALAILNNVIYATVATTASDGSPWAAPQFVAYNPKAKQLYWCASRNSQHAQNILANHQVFIVVYDSSVGPGEGNGVYIRAQAQEVGDPEDLAHAMIQLIARHQGVPYWSLESIQAPNSPVAVFAATIEQAWVNDDRQEHGQFVLYRKSIDL